MEQVLLAQLAMARRNMAEAVEGEDYVEAGVWSIRIEALEDVLTEASTQTKQDNVVNIHG